MPSGLNDGAERVEEALHDYLARRGKAIEAIGYVDARDAWLASVKECRSQAEPGCNGFDGAMRVLARRLRLDREFDVLIVPYLLLQPAKVHLRTASWDGVERELEIVGMSPGISLDSVTMNAPSLAVFVFSSDGEKLYRGVGGLDLAHYLHVVPNRHSASTFSMAFELLDDVFTDPEPLREGIAIAMDPLLPRSDATPGP